MRNQTRLLLSSVLLAVAPSACLSPNLPEVTAGLICETDLDCPVGYFCAPNPHRCANDDSDLDPPTVIVAEVVTRRANINSTVLVQLAADEELSEADIWYVRGDDVVYLAAFRSIDMSEAAAGITGNQDYVYEADGWGSRGEGDAKVFAVVRDLFGNWGELTELGSFLLDNTGPEPFNAALSQARVAPGATVTLVFSTDEPVLGIPDVFIELPSGRESFAWTEFTYRPYSFSLVIPPAAVAGTYSVFIVLWDNLENESRWELPAALTIL